MKHPLVILSLLLLPFLSTAVMGQESRSTISGTIVDQTDAAIPGVKVIATEVRTGTKTQAVSDAAGLYTIPFLAPGEYQIEAQAPGFKTLVRKGIRLASSDHPVIDLKLEVGATSQSLEITADVPLVDTANSAIGQTITTRQVEDFPLNGRNPMMVAQLAIGVIATGTPSLVHPFDNGAAAAWSIGGTPAQTSEILMDGAPNSTWDNRLAYAPPQDAVQEVKVKAFDVDAAYGHTGSGTINKVMKTGTNSLHGSIYEFTQPSGLAANNFFNNKAGVRAPDSKLNQYGLTAGGPVILPKLFHGKNKLFWFFAFEGLKDSQPNTKFLTVPTDAERRGDFSALLALGSSYQIYNPYSGVTSGSNVARQPFRCDVSGNPLTPNLTPGPQYGTQPATGTPCNILPQQLLDPVASAYLKFYPAANLPGRNDGYSNYGNGATTDDNYSNELGRLDWNMSQRSRLAFNVRHNDHFQTKNNYFGNNSNSIASNLTRRNWGATVDEVYTLNNSTVFNVRANYTLMREAHPSISAGFDPTSLGFPSYLARSSEYLELPNISLGSSCGNDTTQAASFDCLGQTGADLLPSQSYQLFGDVTKEWRTHVFKFGVDARQYKLDAQTYGASTGSFTFGTGWTNGPNSSSPAANFGQDFAAFLLGLPTSGNFDLNTRGTYTSYYYGFFLQDDWRIKRNLTLNLGIRFDEDTPYSERLGRTNNGFNLTAKNPVADAAIAAYNARTASAMPFPINFAVPGGLTFPSPGNGNVYDITSHLLSPRVGFAWTPEMFAGKLVFRGGFGLFVQPIAMSNLNPTGGYSSVPILTQQGFSQSTPFPVPSPLLKPTTTLSNPFPNGFLQPSGSSAGLGTFNGQGLNFLNPKMQNPYSERWTFGFQREVMHDMVVEVAYIGNHTVHLPVAFTQLNGIPRQYLSTLPYRDTALNSTLTATVPNPFAGLLPGTNLNLANVAVQQLLAPFPEYPVSGPTSVGTGVTERNADLGSSYFNSFNVRLEKRLSHGVQLVTTYIWSKLIERDEWLNNTDPAPEKRVSPFDHTHRFVTAVNYDLPVGRGKLANLQSRWLDVILGGWRLNGIYTYQTGAPIPWLNNSSNNPGDYPLCSMPTGHIPP